MTNQLEEGECFVQTVATRIPLGLPATDKSPPWVAKSRHLGKCSDGELFGGRVWEHPFPLRYSRSCFLLLSPLSWSQHLDPNSAPPSPLLLPPRWQGLAFQSLIAGLDRLSQVNVSPVKAGLRRHLREHWLCGSFRGWGEMIMNTSI